MVDMSVFHTDSSYGKFQSAGFDKPDLAFVIHYQTPGSVVAYYQQIGHAGRALDAAYGILHSGDEETDITGYMPNSQVQMQ